MERSLVILKPDALQRSIVGEVITRFEKVGLKIVACKMLSPDYDHYYHHYENISQMITRRGQKAFDVTLEMMNRGPVIVIVLEGVEAISLVRKMVGTTEPKAAHPGTIRGDYAHMSFAHADTKSQGVANIVHASGDGTEAAKEIAHWFKKEELFSYTLSHESHTHAT